MEKTMTRQEVWWQTFWAALNGAATKKFSPAEIVKQAKRIADEAIERFTGTNALGYEGYVYNPDSVSVSDFQANHSGKDDANST
jgi:hypothetical protein